MRSIKLILLVVMLLGITTSCQEDEFSYSGTLSISFTNHPLDIYVTIFSLDNLDIPIDNFQLSPSGKAVKHLNIGNYFIRVSSLTTTFSSIGFQIKSNSTTTIIWGEDNQAEVQ